MGVDVGNDGMAVLMSVGIFEGVREPVQVGYSTSSSVGEYHFSEASDGDVVGRKVGIREGFDVGNGEGKGQSESESFATASSTQVASNMLLLLQNMFSV
mmetsp:Transcript_43347/g.80614  ORF Transcript_43347/g.80614 Transcript_43347/m.80614 type:complete len:99 (-) Transcript_43347:287-583(-)